MPLLLSLPRPAAISRTTPSMVFRPAAVLPVRTRLAIFSSMATISVTEDDESDDNLVAAGFPTSGNPFPSFALASRRLHVAVSSLDHQRVQKVGMRS